jgi:nucleoside phosphorylase
MKILIVEDNPDKLRQVLSAIVAGGCKDEDIHIAHDGREAKLRMEEYQYDLMVLDLVIPPHPAAAPERDGGVKLLRELRERECFRVPREVVGLTAFADIKDDAAEMFAEDMWSIITYDRTSESWSDQLSRKVWHLRLAERSDGHLGFNCRLCVLTALPMELEAVRRLRWKWEEFERPSDVTLYSRGEFAARGKTHTVYAACATRMGMTATSILATKMIEAFRPEFVFMTGIAAGVQGRCELGDVIVADPSWDWGSGKYTIQNGGSNFEPAPHQLPISSSMRLNLQRLMNQAHLFDEVRRAWPGDAPKTPLRMLIGPVASGASVLADGEIISTIEQQHRKLLAIEMEAYGLYAAAWDSRVPQPSALSLKGVADFADGAKSDDFQKYAAYTSCETMRLLVEQFL